MLDIGWQELLVIGALALIVVGPRDLPSLLRTVGQWVGKVRGMARDFQRTMSDAARETEVSAFNDLKDLKKINPLDDFKKQAANAQSFLNGSGDGAADSKSADSTASPAKPAPVEEDDPGMVDTTSSEPAKPAAPAAASAAASASPTPSAAETVAAAPAAEPAQPDTETAPKASTS